MGFLQCYSAFLVQHPGKVLVLSSISVFILFVITFKIRPLQSFNDPLIGFEARGTEIGARLNTWRLLSGETTASANNISLLPDWPWYDGRHHQYHKNGLRSDYDQIDSSSSNSVLSELPIIESSIQKIDGVINGTLTDRDVMDEDEEEYYRMVNSTRDTQLPLMHHSLGSSKAFCGKLYEGYAQAIISTSTAYSNHGLFNINSLLAVCQLDRGLRLEHSLQENNLFANECEQYRSTEMKTQDEYKTATCCNSWSLPNYIACLNNKTSCINLDVHDVRSTERLLDLCIPYYLDSPYEECFTVQAEVADTTSRPHNDIFVNSMTNTNSKFHCGKIPSECLKCGGWTYNVLHYLTSENFLRHKPSTGVINEPTHRTRLPSRITNLSQRDTGIYKLTYTSIFLPIAKSSSLMRYYLALSKHNLKTPYAQVKVLNLGLKNSLFEHLVSDETRLFVIALMSVMVIISIYTWSIILSFVILLIICLSLCLSYTIYELILGIAIFPFMNLLAIVISFGICSDNAMLFCKHWSLCREEIYHVPKGSAGDTSDPNSTTPQTADKSDLDRMLKKAIMSTSAATLATACSFIISAISQVTAVRCFCIFATLSVITNYILIIILLPPALILDAKFRDFLTKCICFKGDYLVELNSYAHGFRQRILDLGNTVHMNWIFTIITRLKFYLIIIFFTLLTSASIFVFNGPGLQLADDDDIPLLSKKHAFEQYDKNLKNQFAFERVKQGELQGGRMMFPQDAPDTLPIRVVFGVKPQDNGDHFDPQSRGTLSFDPLFDIANQRSQVWLLDFCQKLRNKHFVHPPTVTDMSNCFMETFKSWMETRTCRDPVYPEIDRSPCCQAYDFPFDRYTFNKCMKEALSIMRRSPHLYPNINAGLRFFKNSSRVSAFIIEFQSNRVYTESFGKMESFYNDINDWVTWQVNNTAPPGLKSGWFISSNLDLFALQSELEQSTCSSVWMEIGLATTALMISTRDIFLTIAGTFTIGTIIVVILAILILLRWTLGVAESILISLTIGLSIDFALHYTVAYGEGLRSRLSHGVIHRILNEVGSPIALAATTTSLAGFIIVWSDILAYQELGTFLMLIAVISWLSSTFFLLPMLATFDSVREFNEQYSRMLIFQVRKMLLDRLSRVG